MKAKPKIALIGCRNVAPASAYSLLNGPLAIEAILIGEHAEQLLKSVAGLIDQSPLRTGSTIRTGQSVELDDAQICVLSSGYPPTATDTEDSFLFRNVGVVREKGSLLRDSGFRGVLIVTTNPAEIMAQAAVEASALPLGSVIGIGPSSIANFMTGRSLPLASWCTATGCDVKFIDACHPDCPSFESMLERFHRSQTSAANESATTMASCVMRVCEAILADEKTVLPVATMLNGQHAIMGTFSNVPCVIGKHGVERVLELPLSDREHENLLDAARETGRLFYRLSRRAASVTSGSIG
jgi:L-lactate dehydrogenase